MLLLSGPAAAQERPAQEQGRGPATGIFALLPEDAVSEHVLEAGEGKLAYAATAGTFDLYQQSGERAAKIFYTAYVLKSAAPERRPLTFVFNGGPGAASAFLHLGLVGPRVLDFGRSNSDGASAQLQDNPATWLPFTDLVLIDPVGTGWSRAAKADDASKYWGVRQDAEALAKTIALYLTRNNRMGSPKYILGESYGGFRAVKIARALQQDQGVIVSGIVMLSPLIEGPLNFGADRFALGAALKLPSLAAAELERRGAFTPEALAEAERFALTDYLTTLAGPPLEGAAADAFNRRVAELTGVPVEDVARTRGFIRSSYIKRGREGAREIVSPYDASFAVPDAFPESAAERSDDPVLDGFVRAYGGAFANYARHELGFRTDITYVLLASEIGGRWDWGGSSLGQASATQDLRELMALNPDFRVLIAHGVSDLVTPYAVSRYVIDHLPAFARSRIDLKLYRGGHMYYVISQSRAASTADARAFYAEGTEP